MKRVFSFGFARTVTVTSPGADYAVESLMVAEEDITIIGYQLTTKMSTSNRLSGEGVVDMDWVLTTSADALGAGVVGWADIHCQVEEFTAGAAMTATYPNPVVMFPDGYGIGIREEGTLSLYHSMHAVEHAGDVSCTVDGTIYYVKQKAV